MRTLLLALVAACGPHIVSMPDHRTVEIAGGTDTMREALAGAVYAAERVYADPAFLRLVAAQWWLPAPTAEPMSGPAVAAALTAQHPTNAHYDLVWFESYYAWQIAGTGVHGVTRACGHIQILRRWVPGDHLVNTVAHENTHLVTLDGQPPCRGQFFDEDHATATDPWLVSYGIGDLAECFSVTGGDPGATRTCYGQMVDMSHACRAYRQCCAPTGGDTPVNLQKIRSLSPQCETRCATLKQECDWRSAPVP